MPADADATAELLDRWYDGDREALAQLLDQNLAWMRATVRRSLDPKLRQKVDSMDLVQEGALHLLKYGPRFKPANRTQFRGLLKKLLHHLILDHAMALRAQRRDVGRERRMKTSQLRLVRDPGATLPAAAAEQRETEQWVQLALEMIEEPSDREVIVLRQFRQLPFEVVAQQMQLSTADAARMKFNRALPRLAARMRALRKASTEFALSVGLSS